MPSFEGGDLHGREGHVAGRGRQDADPDADARGAAERHRGLRDAAAVSEIFDHPDLVESEMLGPLHEVDHLACGQIAGEHDTDAG